MEAREQSSTVSLAYREKTNQEVLSLMVFITEFRQQFSVPFSSSEQHFGIIYPVTLIQKKKKTVLPQRNVLILQAPHLYCCIACASSSGPKRAG